MISRPSTPAARSSIFASFEGIWPALIGLALLSALTACQALPQRSQESVIAALHAELDRLEAQGLAGQVLIMQADDRLLARALGTKHPDRSAPVTMDSVMPLASVSKPFTASALLALAADGKLNLNDPLGHHVKGLSEAWQDLPIHHLLTHTAGLSAEIFNPAWPGQPRFEPIYQATLIRRVTQFPPDHAPGAVFNYSNVGYNLIAAVVESVSAQPLEAFLHDRLLEPAGIQDIGLLLPEWSDEDLVHGRDGEQTVGHHLLQPRLDDGLGWHSRGSGDLLARPDAMVAWWQTLRERCWLPQPWMDRFLEPRVEQSDGSRYGFGLEFRDSPLGLEIGHTGSDLEFSIAWAWWPEYDLMVYVALADSRWRADELGAQMALSLLPHLPSTANGIGSNSLISS